MENEKRLIDANALKAHINGVSTHWLNDWRTLGILAAVDKQPTVDAVEVVHGRWITDEKGKTYCSRCRVIDDYASVHNYCPFCGANMKGENNNG